MNESYLDILSKKQIKLENENDKLYQKISQLKNEIGNLETKINVNNHKLDRIADQIKHIM